MLTSVPDCPFCEIVQLDDPDVREIYRDDHVVAFFPTEPAVLGHTLIVPREHIRDIWSLPEESAAQLARVVVRLAGVIGKAASSEGLNVIQSNGAVATQTVFHLHVHLVPRKTGDAMGPIWPQQTDYSENEKDEMQNRIREVIRQGRSE